MQKLRKKFKGSENYPSIPDFLKSIFDRVLRLQSGILQIPDPWGRRSIWLWQWGNEKVHAWSLPAVNPQAPSSVADSILGQQVLQERKTELRD